MIRESRNLVLEVTDYSDKVLCSLYDNSVDSSGQAFDVFVASERNGWKELSFEIPSTMNTPDGVERNFRLDFLKPNYKIRLIDDFGEDFFLISQSAQKHNGKNTNMSVKVGHISQLLKTKRLDLEFSDKEGNNVGTAAELLTTILEGTGWTPGYVEQFLEKNGVTVKKRSLKASAKSGAFKLISSMCTLFDAKPIYHGKEKTVDIIPINPFAKPNNGELPDVTKADGVVELAYSHNVTNVTRSENGENIATKLYAYGSYGDTTDGYCGIDECTHKEHVYTLQSSLAANTKYYFSYVDDNGTTVYRNFTTDRAIPSGSRVIYSMLDPASQMYAWVETDGNTFGDDDQLILNDLSSAEQTYIRNSTNVNGYAYYVGVGNAGTALPTSSIETELVQNWFSFLMDFTYFQTVGLLENEGLQYIAEYQRFANPLYELSYMKQQQFAATQIDLADTIGDIDFCKLNVSSITNNGGYACINLNKTTAYPDGIVYRSDYEINTKEHFIWTPSPELKSNGDPKTTGASMLLVVYNTTPATWTKAYLRAMDDKDNPSKLTFHIDYSKMPSYSSSNKYYLFGSNNINGYLGGLEIGDESNTTAINNKTKTVTVNHYVRFSPNRPTIISITDPGAGTHMDYDLDWYKIDHYGWWYKCDDDYNTESELYFCYYDHFTPTETTWSRVRFQKAQPSAPSGGATEYWYNWGTAVLYRYMGGSWTALDSPDEKKVAAMFSPVYKACRTHDLYRKGMYEYYTYTAPGTLNAGNYFLSGPYDGYHVFTTTESLSNGDKIIYEAPAHEMYIAKNGSLDPIQADLTMEPGWINNVGAEVNDTTKCRSANFISVTAGRGYSLTGLSDAYRLTLYKYDSSKEFVSKIDNLSGYDGTFQIETGVSYIKFSTDVFAEIFNQYTSFKILNGIKKTIEFKDYRFDNVQYPEGAQPDVDTTIIIEKQNYTKLTPTVASGRIYGIAALVKDFADYSDEAYITDYAAAKAAQSILDHMSEAFSNKLGPMYLEGYWQKKDYVDGDEDKLYEDALDTIKEISHPKATYQITYLDQYGLEKNNDNGVSPLTTATRWPDLTTQSAAHLIDPELGINCWAYIDKINKCYDVPSKTTIAVNTDLSTISQHSFADVMANIADVANSVKAKEELIDRAGAITGRGRFDANRLQGAIDAAKLAIFGGSSTWYTDDNGNMVFESADGRAAMTLTGSGFAIANTKDEWGDWNWRTMGTGDGLVADEITTGHLSSNLIEAGSISVDKVDAGFGTELDVSENQSVVTANENASEALGKAQEAESMAENAQHTFVQATAPTTGYKKGDIWKCTTNNWTYYAMSATGNPSTDWILSSAGLVSGAKFSLNPEDGTAAITADQAVTIASSGTLQMAGSHVTMVADPTSEQGGQLDILGGSVVNIGSNSENGAINIQSKGSINIAAGGKLNLASADGVTLTSGNTLLNAAVGEATLAVSGHNMLGNGDESATNSNSYVKEWFYFEEMAPGQDYTFTVCIKPAQDVAVTHYRLFSSANGGSVAWIYPDGTDKQVLSVSFTFSNSGYANDNHVMRLYLPNQVTTTANTTIYWAVLEKGRKSPNGNPSPKNICEWSPCRNGSYNLLYGADDVKPMPALSTDTWFGDWNSDDMVAGEIYTFTACVKPGSGWTYFDLRTCADQSTTLKLATIYFLGTQKQVVSGTFTFPGYTAGSTDHRVYGRMKPDGTSTSGTVYWAKLCKGTEREAWSSNINEINNSKVTIDNTGINLLTGGVMNLSANSGININSGSNLNVAADGNVTIASGGKLNVSASDIIVSTSTNQTLTEQINSSIQLSVSQLTTGGTNMILNGDKEFSGTTYQLAEWPYFQELAPGETYTFTVCMTPAPQTAVSNYSLFTSAGTGSVGRLYPSGIDKQILSLTFKFRDDGYAGTNHVMRLYRGENVATTSSTTIHWAKLEKAATGATIGSKIVTDVPYSPPPNGSDNMLYNSNVQMVASNASERWFGDWQCDKLIVGETYTFTACIKPGSDHTSFSLNIHGVTELVNMISYISGTGKQVVSGTFVYDGPADTNGLIACWRRPATVTTAGTLYWAKLCKGTNKEAWSPNPNEINGSTIKVTKDSIGITTGGTLNMSGGTVNIESGGTLNISAGTKGTIDLQDGVISSKKGVFDTIEVKSGSTTMNIQPSTSNQAFLMPIKCYFTKNASQKPSNTDHEYLWFNSSTSTTLNSTVNVPYSGAPSVSPDGKSFTSAAVSDVLTNNTVTYKLTVTLNRNAGRSSTNTIPIGATARVYNTNSGSSNYVDLTASAQSMGKWDAHTFELTGSSSTAAKNLFASKNTLSITLKTVNDVNEPCYVYGQMTLTGTSAGSASEGTVTVTYVP